MSSLDPKLAAIQQFLLCETPDAWVTTALSNQKLMLIDHSNCERKAASTALNLIFRYTDRIDLLNKMSRLAREELRHFEQVIAIMQKRGIAYDYLSASRYADGLRRHIRTHEPARLVDVLIVGAFIEARSCERFARIAPHLDEELSRFYSGLLASEARHYQEYLSLAQRYADGPIDDRIAFFAEIEAGLIQSPDPDFRFHSGLPVEAAA